MPDDKVSVNPNMVVMNEIDVLDTENVIASAGLIPVPQENGFLVSSQKGEVADDQITKIDIQKTYGSEDFGNGQYIRYWQGVNYLNEALSGTVSVERKDGAAPEGPFNTEYSPSARSIEDVLDDPDFPAETSAYWVFAALNDLCDNDRARYGANVKLYWEKYQKALIEQQGAVDEEMARIYAQSPAQAEETAAALGKAVSEEVLADAKSILTELRGFIAADKAGELTEDDVFTPTVLTENKMPTYSIEMATEAQTGFDDVASSAWYADAVAWAAEHKIVNGVSETAFAPDDNITREQMAAILYRYAEYRGKSEVFVYRSQISAHKKQNAG